MDKIDKQGRYMKGHIPANKGVKGKRCSKETEFKKGDKPKTFKGFGVKKLTKNSWGNGYVVTIDEQREVKSRGRTYMRSKNITYASYLWRENIGEIPKGYVIYNTGDRDDIKLENLACITRGMLLSVNSGKLSILPYSYHE